MSHVLKEHHQRWFPDGRQSEIRESSKTVTPFLETAKTWLTSKITTEKHFSTIIIKSQITRDWGMYRVRFPKVSAHFLSPTPSLSTQRLSLQRVGYPDIPTLSGSLYSTREGDKKQLQPNCLILHTRTILKSLCSRNAWTAPAIC